MSSLKRLAVIGSGNGTTAESIIEATRRGELAAEVVLIIGNNSRSGIFAVAARNNVPSVHLSTVTHPDDADRDAAMLRTLAAAGADLIILAGYLKKIGPQVLEAYRGRMINTHPALLPAYGSTGMYGDRVHAAVLADGVPETGATVHVVTENYDEGPILDQQRVPVTADDDVVSLRNRVQAAEKALLLRWLQRWASSDESRVVPAVITDERPGLPRDLLADP